jgi:RNA polymerase sigma-70 factor (ECF subfamily)
VDDRELVARLIAGDREAWTCFVGARTPIVAAMARRVLGERARGDVADVVQAVFAKLWADDCRRLRAFRGQARLTTWLATIARREALDRLRRRRRLAAHETNGDARDLERAAAVLSPSPEARAARADEILRLRSALEAIPDRDRLLILWIHEDRVPYARVAELLGLKENSIGPLLQRARRRLDDALERAGPDGLYGSDTDVPPTRRPGPRMEAPETH